MPDEDRRWSRRAFLAASGGLALAATALPELAFAHEEPKLGKDVSVLQLSSDLFARPEPQRFVFGLGSEKGYVSGPPVRVGVVPPGVSGNQKIELQATRFYKGGLPEGRGVYVAEPVFDTPGHWTVAALVQKKQIFSTVHVSDAPVAPQPGSAAPRAASPTLSDTLGVKPICTRRPKCPLHDVSLSDVIGDGTPVALLFATPARCQSEYCGPVLDTLLSVRDRYPDIRFVHVEIYKNNKTTDHVPTLDAWGLESEPWLFTIDGVGTIVDSLDGAFGKGEIVQNLDALAAS